MSTLLQAYLAATLLAHMHMRVSEKCHQRGVRQEEGSSGGDGGKIEWKSFEIITRAVSRGQNELIGEFKLVVVLGGKLWRIFQQGW